MSIPEDRNTFQGIGFAFHRFQSFSAVTLFTAVLNALQDQACQELKRQHPDRFRNKGFQNRTWEMPFETVNFPMAKWYDRQEKKVIRPLDIALDVPDRVRYCEETLLPGYRLATLQSYRVSRNTQATEHQGRTYGRSTLHRRFQGFAEHMNPVPDMKHQHGSKPTAFQQADGTKLAMQDHGRNLKKADLRLVVGSRTPHGPLEILDFSLGKTWDDISKRIRERFPAPPKVLVTDGEPGIAEALSGPDTIHQRCLFHAKHQLKFALYQDEIKKEGQKPIVKAFSKIPAFRLCQEEVQRLENADRKDVKLLLETSEKAFENLKRRLPDKEFPATRQYVLGLIDNGLSYLRRLLQGDSAIPVTTNRMESIMSRLAMRLKWIGRRWSAQGGLNMLAAVLTLALHPARYQEVVSLLKGEKGPVVGVVITSLEASWLSQCAT